MIKRYLVGEEGSSALVPELSVFVLLEGDLPGPLAVVGDSPAHDPRPAHPHEPPPAHVLVVRRRLQRVEERPLAVGPGIAVVEGVRHVEGFAENGKKMDAL